MTHLPPPTDEPGSGRSDASERHNSERAATRRPRGARAGDPRLELSAPIRSTSRPFAWQHGPRLYLLVNESRRWVLAELEFVPSACHYVEIRRTNYRWPREAIGVLLSRSLTADEDTARRLASDVSAWLAAGQEPLSVWHRDFDA